MQIDPKSLTGTWSYPTQVRFGPGRIAELPRACKSLGMSRPLLVTDPGLAALPMIAEAVAANDGGGPADRRSSATSSPTRSAEMSRDGVAAFREGGHDGVIAFGGGSGLDAAKAIAFMAGQDRPIWDFEDVGATGSGPIRRASPLSSRCRPPPAPARRSAAPRSSCRRRPTASGSSSTPRSCPAS